MNGPDRRIETVAREFRRASHVADIWAVPTALATDGRAVLSPDEREQSGRFRFPEDRARYVAGHAALRLLLATYLGTSPEVFEFDRTKEGKPFLAGAGIHFNLSHSGDYALVAIAHAPVGIDIERIAPRHNIMNIAARFFHPDETSWLESRAEPERLRAFYRLWTMKEAALKATGKGIGGGLDRIRVEFGPDRDSAGLRIEGDDGSTMTDTSSAELVIAAGYAAAVVVGRSGVLTRVRPFAGSTR